MGFVKSAVRLLVHGYYRSVDVLNPERVPAEGPVLLCPTHPNSLFDPLAVGCALPRRVRFVAKHTLFAFPMGPLLRAVGVIPIRRRQDLEEAGLSAAEAQALNDAAFEACWEVLDRGGAVGIFPEGITHDAPRLAPVKTGPARIALGAEARRGFSMGLVMVPVGLHFPRKATFRSEARIAFGEPIRISDWRARHEADPREAVRELTEALEAALRELTPDIREGDEALVRDVLEVYADRIPAEEALDKARQAAKAVGRLREEDPDAFAALEKELSAYRRILERLGISDRTLGRSLSPEALREEGLPRTAFLILGLPLALWGLLNHVLVGRLAALSVRWFARKADGTMVALQRLLGGLVGIPLTYALQGWAVHRAFGDLRITLGYLATLPASGLFAWAWLGKLARTRLTLEEGAVLLTHRWILSRLRRRRARLRRSLDRARERLTAS